jgi:hypothetical protein
MMSADPDLAADLRQCVIAVRELWATVQADAEVNRKADQALVRGLSA